MQKIKITDWEPPSQHSLPQGLVDYLAKIKTERNTVWVHRMSRDQTTGKEEEWVTEFPADPAEFESTVTRLTLGAEGPQMVAPISEAVAKRYQEQRPKPADPEPEDNTEWGKLKRFRLFGKSGQ